MDSVTTIDVLDLFSGIGGFSLGLEMASNRFKTVAFAEINHYCCAILEKRFPAVKNYGDVVNVTSDRLARDGIKPRIIAGGFPCQDLSKAGRLGGIDAGRSGLWSEYSRIIGELRPEYAIIENVPNLLAGDGGDWFRRVLWDLCEIGYDAEWHCVPASFSISAPHHRDRVWILAYPHGSRLEGRAETVLSKRSFKRIAWEGSPCPVTEWDHGLEVEHDFFGVAHGISNRVDRLKSIGNAVVPQLVKCIGSSILEEIEEKEMQSAGLLG